MIKSVHLAIAVGLLSTGCPSEPPPTTGSSAAPAAQNPAPSAHDPAPPPTASAATPAPSATGSAAAPSAWGFDTAQPDAAPAGFSLGRIGGPPGKWVIRAEADAPSKPNVLAQLDADKTDGRFAVAVADAPSLKDVRVAVRCKPVSGTVDQACGLVFRYRDENNYYLTRANALEGNVRLYFVKDGRRQQLASWSGAVTSKAWHALAVVAKEDHLTVSWNGKEVIDHHDKTFTEPGKVGVWTKADSVTYFDDLTVAQP